MSLHSGGKKILLAGECGRGSRRKKAMLRRTGVWGKKESEKKPPNYGGSIISPVA